MGIMARRWKDLVTPVLVAKAKLPALRRSGGRCGRRKRILTIEASPAAQNLTSLFVVEVRLACPEDVTVANVDVLAIGDVEPSVPVMVRSKAQKQYLAQFLAFWGVELQVRRPSAS
eukprot:2324400-Amphidinium_carterae.1